VYAGTRGYVDDLPVEEVRRLESELYQFVDTHHPSLLQKLMEKKQLDDALRQEFDRVLKEFKERFLTEGQPAKSTPSGAAR
ncbi:MAG: F0F1 ATP synthase subunit alpha, partial [Acidobacteria bacterium]|nr:F0F1 ATP synthase subunit alpha [Acidobacteriota bacterium]